MTPSLDSRPAVLPVCADSWELVAETPEKSRRGESSQSGYVSASNSRAKARAQVAGSALLPGLEEPEMPREPFVGSVTLAFQKPWHLGSLRRFLLSWSFSIFGDGHIDEGECRKLWLKEQKRKD